MRQIIAIAVAVLAVGCTTGPASKGPESPEKPAAVTAAPAPKADPAPAADRSRVGPLGLSLPDDTGPDAETPTFVTDPKTGQAQMKIPKRAKNYYADRGVVRNIALNARYSMPILREDAEAWYVGAPAIEPKTPEEIEATRARVKVAENAAQPQAPVAELEEILPARSAVRLRLEEISAGLPTSGYWRQNFALADLEGDKTLEIVTTPPRLTVNVIRVFKLQGKAWTTPPLKFDVPEGASFEYGGVAAGDIDGDGKVDLVAVGHGTGGGPLIAYNLGGLHFRVETKGMPRAISARAVAIADLDGNGRPDLITLSDEAQYLKRLELGINPNSMNEAEPGLAPAYDMRSFMQAADGTFAENHVGLDAACFGYDVQAWANPPDGGEPFIATDCRYLGGTMMIYGFDKEARSFHRVGIDFGEDAAIHSGVGLGLYHGHPAAFMGYTKSGAPELPKPIDGGGVSAYYREQGEWKRKRIIKFIDPKAALSQGIAVGDLDGDGLDDVVWADETNHRLRIFFQRPSGEFEEMDPALEPTFVNRATCLRIGDVDGDGKNDIVFMYETGTGLKTRQGGLRFFRNLGPK